MNEKSHMIYMDNACTTFPKPSSVADKVYEYMTKCGSNINRGLYEQAYSTEEMVFATRERLLDLFNGPDVRNVIFTRGITESLNIVIKGLLKEGDHVCVSPYEHNAVMRPLNGVSALKGVSFERIATTIDGRLDVSAFEKMIRDNTRAVIINHASNVSGLIMPIEEIGEICHRRGIKFIVDTAQTAGLVPIDMLNNHIDVLTFTGHKGLMGPQGIGGMIVTDEMGELITPFIEGGTGSISDTERTPDFLPDKFEAGTLNIVGIVGLNEGIKWINSVGISSIHKREAELRERFIEGITDLEQSGLIRIVGKKAKACRDEYVGVVSVSCKGIDNAEAAILLDEKYHIMTRVGLHCAPAAHKTLGTFPEGTVRFSFGYFNTFEEIDTAVMAIHEIVGETGEKSWK